MSDQHRSEETEDRFEIVFALTVLSLALLAVVAVLVVLLAQW